MADVFASGILSAIAVGIIVWIVIQGLAWIVNLARYVLMDD